MGRGSVSKPPIDPSSVLSLTLPSVSVLSFALSTAASSSIDSRASSTFDWGTWFGSMISCDFSRAKVKSKFEISHTMELMKIVFVFWLVHAVIVLSIDRILIYSGEQSIVCMECSFRVTSVVTAQSCPRVGWTRGSGRVGSRFCRILAGLVGSALRIFKFFTDYFLVPESIWIFEYYIRIDWFLTIFNM